MKRKQPGKSAYSRALHVLKSDPDRLLIFSGAGFNDEATDPVVPFTVTALSVSKLVADGYSNEG